MGKTSQSPPVSLVPFKENFLSNIQKKYCFLTDWLGCYFKKLHYQLLTHSPGNSSLLTSPFPSQGSFPCSNKETTSGLDMLRPACGKWNTFKISPWILTKKEAIIRNARYKYERCQNTGSWHIAYWAHIAYWVQHFPQHHLSGSGIAQLEFYHCWEPAWGTPPMAKVMRKEARHMQRRDRASGVPWKFSSIYPQTRVCLLSALCSHLHLWLYGGCPPLPLSEKKRVSLQLQLIIPGCDSVSTYKLLWKSSSLPE